MKLSVAVLSLFLAASMAMPAPVCGFFSFLPLSWLVGAWVSDLGVWLNVEVLTEYKRSRTRSAKTSRLTMLLVYWLTRRA